MNSLAVARAVAGKLIADGALAVVLAGSHARGNATDRSDLDLYVIGAGPAYQLRHESGLLVSVSWRTLDEELSGFFDPGRCGAVVPGWRTAVVLHDPDGIAAGLVERAHSWTWQEVGDERINTWVADELTGLAEEVNKLVGMLEQGRLQAAAVQRLVLSLRIPIVMATHLRLLYDSENVLWDLVAERIGAEWARFQATALGVIERPFQDGCHAALRLYQSASDLLADRLTDTQRAVIQAANSAIDTYRPHFQSNHVVVVLIEHDGRFLVVEENDGNGNPAWYFPAGSVEAGESLADAAIREAREESGWTVTPTHLFRVDHSYLPSAPGVAWWRHVIVARPGFDTPPVAPESSILNVEWLTADDLSRRTQRGDDAVRMIEDYLTCGPGLALNRYVFSDDGTLHGFFTNASTTSAP
jgi:8-oxo-dGTP pyrophosphatase MutT (NUDIX family)